MFLNTLQNLSRTIYHNNKTKKHKFKPKLKIPYVWYFTDDVKTKNPCFTIRHLPKKNGIIIRKYNSKQKYKNIKNLIKSARKNSLIVLVAGNIIQFPFANGNHIPKWIYKKPKNNKIISTSVHSSRDIRKCINIKANLVFVSPIFKTTSHLHAKPLGTVKLGLLARKFKIPVIALGGINEKNIKLLRNLPIYGCAGINIFENIIHNDTNL